MRERKLVWWVLRSLSAFVLVGATLSTYHQFRVCRRVGVEAASQLLQQNCLLARDIVAQSLAAAAGSTAHTNELCDRIARTTNSRVTLIGGDGVVYGDSQYGSNFRLEGPVEIHRFSKSYDHSLGREIGSFSVPVSAAGQQNHYVLRLSTPLPSVWEKARMLAPSAIGTFLIAMGLVAVCSLLIARTVGRELDDVTAMIRDYRLGEAESKVPGSAIAELNSLAAAVRAMMRGFRTNYLELQEKSNQWKAIFTSMREGVVALDAERRILTINYSATRFLDVADPDSVLGRPLVEVIRHSDLNAFVVDLLSGADSFREMEIVLDEPDLPAVRWYHVSGVKVGFQEETPPGLLLVFNDVTTIRKLENVRQEFVANVSHELKTPVTTIKGLIEPLPECIEKNPAQAQRFVELIARNTDRLQTIINDLLYLSSLDQEEEQLIKDFQARNIAGAIHQSVATFQPKAGKKNITLAMDVTDVSVSANHRLLEQAIGNLLDNAIKYSPEGSRIEISAKPAGENLEIAVADHGMGIHPDQQERIFERFYRVDKSRDRQTGGSGLGLSIVKHIVQIHRGVVEVRSQPGQGSCFTIKLPLHG